MKRVILTGASGFIGYHLANELCMKKIEVYAICKPGSTTASRLTELNGVRIIYCSLEESDRLPELLNERGFDVFYHLAWEGSSGLLRSDFVTQTNNIKWTGIIAEVAKKLRCRKLIVAGTVCELQSTAILQTDRFINSSLYLLSKRSAYELVSKLCLQLKLPLVWCAFYHPIGRYNKENQLLSNTIRLLLSNESPRFGPADQWFDVIAVEDLAYAFLLAGDKELIRNWYFVGSGQPRKLKNYIMRVGELVAPDIPLQYSYYPADGLPMEEEWLDISLFVKETGYHPRFSFDEAVINTKKWILEELPERLEE